MLRSKIPTPRAGNLFCPNIYLFIYFIRKSFAGMRFGLGSHWVIKSPPDHTGNWCTISRNLFFPRILFWFCMSGEKKKKNPTFEEGWNICNTSFLILNHHLMSSSQVTGWVLSGVARVGGAVSRARGRSPAEPQQAGEAKWICTFFSK